MFLEVFRVAFSIYSSHKTEHFPRWPKTRAKREQISIEIQRHLDDIVSSKLPEHRCRNSVTAHNSKSDVENDREVAARL